jgi:hypothetical protein
MKLDVCKRHKCAPLAVSSSEKILLLNNLEAPNLRLNSPGGPNNNVKTCKNLLDLLLPCRDKQFVVRGEKVCGVLKMDG